MNNFANLSAESEVSRLAFVASEEVCTVETVVVSGGCVNIAKLARRNLRVAINARIDRAELETRVAGARHRGNMVALHASIRAELESEFAAIARREDTLASL